MAVPLKRTGGLQEHDVSKAEPVTVALLNGPRAKREHRVDNAQQLEEHKRLSAKAPDEIGRPMRVRQLTNKKHQHERQTKV